MKIILMCIIYAVSLSCFSQTNAELQQQLLELQKRMESMEKNSGRKNGLKMKDFGGDTTSSPQNRVNTRQGASSQIPEAEMKEIMESLKKGDSYLKERDKFLKELENED